jgi:hypothetical protein
MNFLVKIPAGEKGERVKAPMRFTNSEFVVNLADVRTAYSLGVCQAQSGFTHSPHSPADFCLKVFTFCVGIRPACQDCPARGKKAPTLGVSLPK